MRIIKNVQSSQQKAERRTGVRDREVYHSEFNNLFAEEITNYSLGSIIKKTYAEALVLKNSTTLEVGSVYKLTDKADKGIFLLAISENQFSLEGQGVFLNPDFQTIGTRAADIQQVWYSGLEPLAAGLVVIWNGVMYETTPDVPGDYNGLGPDNNPEAYTLISKSATNGYIEEVDFILYDFDNDIILERNDKRNNKIAFFDTIATFQWGNNNVVNNTVVSGGYYLILNQRGVIASNFVESAGSLYVNEENEGDIISCTFKGNQVDANLNAGQNCVECSFDLINNITLSPSLSNTGKKISKNESTFEATINAFAAGVLTIPSILSYVGIFTLENPSGSTITKIVNMPTTHKVRFYAKPTVTQLFSHTTIVGAISDQLVSDAAAINTITGRTNGSDFIEYERAGNLNRRYNAVISA